MMMNKQISKAIIYYYFDKKLNLLSNYFYEMNNF